MLETLVATTIVLFLFSQTAYFVVNALANLLLFPRHVNIVTDATSEETPLINVLVPVYGEPERVLVRTLETLGDIDYPNDAIEVYLLYESDDEVVTDYVDDLHGDLPMFTPIAVNHDLLRWHDIGTEWDVGGDFTKTKAAALNYAFYTLTFPPDSVITVFDSDTIVPDDLFRLAVTGLKDYEIVQAKQTVRNLDDGWLPRLEAMGMAAWSHIVYPKTTGGPYQLLGKGYFIRVGDLYDLDAWDTEDVTEDMSLGVAAHQEGYSLGVLDGYVQDLCPDEYDEWVRQKTRWVSGPYRILTSSGLSPIDSIRFATFTLSNQFLSIVNLLGVPFGILALGLQVTGHLSISGLLAVIVLFNFVNWTYYSMRTYEAAAAGIPFDSRRERVGYFLLANPLTQAVYATLWVVPISHALAQSLRGEERTFEVTKK